LTLGLRGKLFLVWLALIVPALLVAYGYAKSVLDRDVLTSIRDDLSVRAALVAARAAAQPSAADDIVAWDGLADELGERARARVTVIRSDGKVLGDSDVPEPRIDGLPSHLNRPEVRQALADGRASAQRYSETVEANMLYMAIAFPFSTSGYGVVRLALRLDQLETVATELNQALAVAAGMTFFMALVMSSLAAHVATQGARNLTATARRMASGNLDVRTRSTGRDELGELGRALDALAGSLSLTLQELRDERDLLRGILSGMQEGVLLLSPERHIALMNPALREMLLLGPDAIGKTMLEAVRHVELKQLLDEAYLTDEPLTREVALGGLKPRALLVRVARLAGDQQGVLAVFVDVTEMRRLESLRRDFVANVSHELRTPIASIRSAAETLQHAGATDPEAVPQFVPMIERNAQRLQQLVEDLLQLSRIESRKLNLTFESVSVPDAFEHLLSVFGENAARRSVELRASKTDEPLCVRADRRALEHVMTNLVDNALKYSGAGASVELAAEQDGENVRLLVKDTGPGIDSVHLPRIFERFYRVDTGRSRDLGGTGLGLSIVKHMTEAMGGTVTVESAVGRGTTFAVALRRA
jgi:two-component system phosphate regulon sensor histidine kinase PhoR